MIIHVVMCLQDGKSDTICARYTTHQQAAIHCEKMTEAAKGAGLSRVFRYLVIQQKVYETYDEYMKEKYP
jgi:hypothetical protein